MKIEKQYNNIFGYKTFATSEEFEKWQKEIAPIQFQSMVPVMNTINHDTANGILHDSCPSYGLMLIYVKEVIELTPPISGE